MQNPPDSDASLRSLFTTFLKIGATGSGGAMALLALVEDEAVTRRQWLSAAILGAILLR